MLNPGYYAVHRDTILSLGTKRTRLSKHDWLVTDGQNIGVFDKGVAMDWYSLEWASGQRLVLTDEISAQIEAAASVTTFAQLERRLQQQLDTEDGEDIPDMPKPPLNALGQYLRANRTLVAYTYEH